jgi:hypothetical protein
LPLPKVWKDSEVRARNGWHCISFDSNDVAGAC